MPEIHIAYDLLSFKQAFVWKATEAEMVRLLQSQREQAVANGLEFSDVVAAVVVQAPQLLANADPTQGRGLRLMLTAWALQLDTKTPKHPGAIIDYIAAYDFWVTITKASGGVIETTVGARPRSDLGLA
jgi:hypothetical protein